MDVLTAVLPKGSHEMLGTPHRVIRSRWIIDSREPPRLRLLLSYLYLVWWFGIQGLSHKYEAVLVNPGAVGNSLLFWMGRFLGVTVIGIVHGEEITAPLYGGRIKDRIKTVLLKVSYRQASGFCCGNHFARKLLLDLGISSEDIDVIPSCVNPGRIKLPPSDKKPGHRVLSVGRLIERKGFRQLVEAAALLKPIISDLRVTIVGDGPLRSVLEEMIESRHLTDTVYVKGGVSDDELARCYQEADLFVLAHRMLENGDTEGCPVVFPEAMAAGLPLIGGTGGGAETAIASGENGYLVEGANVEQLASRIQEILLKPTLAKQMGETSVKKVRENHDPRKNGRALFYTIRRLLEGRVVA